MWPDFFIVGAPKAGTTSLYEYLRNSEKVFMPEIKEPNFFCQSIDPKHFIFKPIRNEKKYCSLFKKNDNVKFGESSVWYLIDPKTPKLIHEKAPNAKIIIMLRNPIERSFSHYLMAYSRGKYSKSFLDIIKDDRKNEEIVPYKEVIRASLYYDSVRRFIEMFGKENVKVIIFEELIQDTKKIVQEVLDFLGIDTKPPENIKKTFNPYGVPRNKISLNILTSEKAKKISEILLPKNLRHDLKFKFLIKKSKKPNITEKEIKYLSNFFKNDVKNLEKLLGKSLLWDEFKN